MNKQIEEMAKMLCIVMDGDCDYCRFDSRPSCPPKRRAERVYNAGYRKQKEGEWVYHECVASYDGAISGFSCSCCSAFIHEEVYEDTSFPNKFCPNCGAKMKGGEEK